MRLAPLLLSLAMLAAGCAEQAPSDDEAEDPGPAVDVERPPLHGWILDPSIRPLAGVNVEVLEANVTTVTDAGGFYGFDGLPTGETMILVATLDGYRSQSRQVTLHPDVPVRLNFTMEKLPEKVPYSEVEVFNGLLSCQFTLVVSESDQTTDCSAGDPGDIWEFSVSPGLAGLVVEVAWDPATDASVSLEATLETLGLGDSNQLLAQAVGTSVLRLQLAEDLAAKLYPAGGQMRLTVRVLPNTDETETGVGVGLALNQEFEAFASAFYVEPPPPTYSIAG